MAGKKDCGGNMDQEQSLGITKRCGVDEEGYNGEAVGKYTVHTEK